MAEAGHNSRLTDKERRALRMYHVKRLAAQDAVVKEATDERKRLRGLVRSEGFKLSEIDAAKRLMTMEDQSIFIDEIKELYGIAQDFGALPADQMDFFEDRRPIVDRAKDEGLAAGLLGKEACSPYAEGSQEDQAWLGYWHEGQKQMAEDLVSAMAKRNADKGDDADEDDELIKGGDPFPDDDDEGGSNVVQLNAAE